MTDMEVGFTSKELFLEVNRKIDLLMDSVHRKAERTEVEHLEQEFRSKLERLERESVKVSTLQENDRKVGELERMTRVQWVGILVSILLALGSLIPKLLVMTK